MSIESICNSLDGLKNSATQLLLDLDESNTGPLAHPLTQAAAEQVLGRLTKGLTDLVDAVCESQSVDDICDALALISAITGALGNAIGHYLNFLPQFRAFAMGLESIAVVATGLEIAFRQLGFCDDPASEPSGSAISQPATSPLIFDLNGDGVQTLALEDSTAFFDLNGDGFAQHTAWVSPEDGLLALDRNANGSIDDINELFGSATQNGFSQLAALDDNGDGVIDALDEAFGSLRLWIDENSDGISEPGELHSLAELGIRLINLAATSVDILNSGNPVTHQSTAENDDGTSLEVLDVWFVHSVINTQFITPDGFEYDSQAEAMPQLMGYGSVPDLRYAMSVDEALRGLVVALVAGANDLTGDQFRAQFEAVLMAWTGAGAIDPGSRGENVDARHLVVLELFFAQEFVQTAGTNSGTGNPGAIAGVDIEQAYLDMLDSLVTRFAVQVAIAQANLATGELEPLQVLAASPFLGLMQIFYNPQVNSLNVTDVDSALAAALADLPEDPAAALSHVDLLMSVLSGLRVDVFGGDANAFHAAMTTALALIEDHALRAFALTRLTQSSDLTRGTAGADNLVIEGQPYRGSDTALEPTADVLSGGTGDDTLSGGVGGDSYLFTAGDGADIVDDRGASNETVTDEWGALVNFGGTDQLLFVGRQSADAVLTRDGDDLIITFAGGDGTDQVRVIGQFGTDDTNTIESFVFADTEWSEADVEALFTMQAATSGADAILGTSGNDVITGGGGDDVLEGRGGGDIYRYASGDGDDIINDRGAGAGDELHLLDLMVTDISVARDGNDAVITVLGPAGGSITLTGQFAGSGQSLIETLQFADGLTWSATDLLIAVTGGLPVAEPITGTGSGEIVTGTAGNDIIDGAGGDDTLDGGAGTDVFLFGFGAGADTLIISRDDRFAEANIISIDAGRAEVVLERDGDDLLVRMVQLITQPDGSIVAQASGDTLLVTGHFSDPLNAVDRISFSDGTYLDIEAINQIAVPDTDSLHLSGVTLQDLTFTRADSPEDRSLNGGAAGADLIVTAGGVVLAVIENHFYDYTNNLGELVTFGVEQIVLDDGTILDRAALAAAAPLTGTAFSDTAGTGADGISLSALVGTDYSETISGFDGDDIIVGEAGDDTIIGGRGDDRLTGDGDYFSYDGAIREGSDSYFYASGDGNDVIYDNGTGAIDVDRLIFTDLTRDEVSLGRSNVNPGTLVDGDFAQLVITVLATGETVSIRLQFYDEFLGLEQIVFADGFVIDRPDLVSQAALLGTSGFDVINGVGLIDPMAGDDQVDGSSPEGTASELIYRAGDGNDQLSNVDSIRFIDLAAGDVSMERVNDTLVIHILQTGQSITVNDQFEPDWWAGQSPDQPFEPSLTQIIFADGEVWDGIRISAEAATTGLSSDDVIVGTPAADLIDAAGGDDDVSGADGDDTIDGGSGDDTLSGDGGDDTFVAGTGDDLITGGAGSDTYDASAGLAAVAIDLAAGSAEGGDIGTNTLGGVENAIGGRGADYLSGDSAANILSGGSGDDQLMGGAGSDWLVGGQGGDTLDGGTGSDTAAYQGSLAGVNVDLVRGTGLGGNAAGDQLAGIENLAGSNYADVLAGDDGDNHLALGGGADTASGRGGADVIDGGSGNDSIDGGEGADSISGGGGADELYGGLGADVITGGGGADVLVGGGGSDTYLWTPGDGDDVITETSSLAADIDRLDLGAATPGSVQLLRRNDDLIIMIAAGGQLLVSGHFAAAAGAGIEEILFDDGTLWDQAAIADAVIDLGNAEPIAVGGAMVVEGGGPIVIAAAGLLEGDVDLDGDVLTIVSAQDAVAGSVALDANGDVVFTPSAGFTGDASFSYTISDGRGGSATATVGLTITVPVIRGGGGNDVLWGSAGEDTISSGDGNDWIHGGGGADTIDGGAGQDTAAYSLSGAAVHIDLAAGTTSGGDAEGDVLIGIENLTGSSFADILVGDGGANVLVGRGGADVISGALGDDWIMGDSGADTIDGGAGRDTAAYSVSGAAVTINLAAGTASGGEAEGDVLIDIENLTGSAFADVLVGDGNANVLVGQGGNDWIQGGGGGDTIVGGDGADTAAYSASGAAVEIDLAAGSTSGGDAQGDLLISIENLTGSVFADTLSGDEAANILVGGLGNDVITAAAGDDWTMGGVGADTIDGGAGRDTAAYTVSASAVAIDLAAGTASGGEAEGDVLTNIENLTGSAFSDTLVGNEAANTLAGHGGADALFGGGGGDVILGYAGDDSLNGGDGDDYLRGDAGTDELTGGAGADTFAFQPDFGHDSITDFSIIDDVLEFHGIALSVSDLIANAIQDDFDTIITIAPDQSVTLLGIDRNSLEEDDFRIV